MIEHISTEIIKSNPYQRRLDLGDVRELADDILANGLLQVPLARRVNGHVELAIGHRRWAAWKLAKPGEPMPVELRELTNRQMADYVISENAQRKDLSAIERAQSIQDYMADFGVTQTEAAKRFGITQAAASNLLRLLRLPKGARGHVHDGTLPERIARQLISISEALPKEVDAIAKAVADTEPDRKESELERRLEEVLHKKTLHLTRKTGYCWPGDWTPPAPVTIYGKEVNLQPCQDCLRHIQSKANNYVRGDFCLWPKCAEAKRELWAIYELARLSKKFKIPIGPIEGETAYILDISYNNRHKAEELLKKKATQCFRLFPLPADEYDSYKYSDHRQVLGSDVVLLASTQKTILEKKADEIKRETIANETEKEKAARLAAEEEAREDGRQERAALRRARHDILWLVTNAADAMAKRMAISGGILDLVQSWERHSVSTPNTQWDEWTAWISGLDKKIKKAAGDERELLIRTHILARHMASLISAYRPEDQYSFSRAIEKIKESAGAFQLELPAGWDQVPVHKTPTNCHVCGRFSSMDDRITKIEEGQGWQTDKSGKVTCSDECRGK